MILVVGGHKGGTGSTTIATNLAVMRARQARVKLIDASEEPSAERFMLTRLNLLDLNPHLAGRVPKLSFQRQRGRLLEPAIEEAAAAYTDIVIDTGRTSGPELRLACARADLLLSPLVANAPDLGTIPGLEAVVAEAVTENPRLKAQLVFNLASNVETRFEDDVSQSIRNDPTIKHLNLLDTVLHQWIAYKDAIWHGMGVDEIRFLARIHQAPKAREEMAALYRELWREAPMELSDESDSGILNATNHRT
ncbi:MAG TPA: ParA family protein [Terriglobales bacterium]